jgi:endo-1,4-beta-mannosidase
MTRDEPFVTGVNYWPRRKAMYWWSDFDPVEVADEFDVVAALGMKVVRIFLLWEDWQPAPDAVAPDCLDHLETVCDLAAERDLALEVTFFTGHMSGPNWAPRWLLDATTPRASSRPVVSGGVVVDSACRNPFHDPEALEAERLLLETVVGRFAEHPAIWMWDLGNEPDNFVHPADAGAGRRWVADMTGLVHDLDPRHPVTIGLHTASLFEDNGLRVDQVFAETDVAVIHGYPMYVPWARSALDPDFVPFLCALVTALCAKPCLVEEWGGCTSPGTPESVVWSWQEYGSQREQFMAGEEAFADYVGRTLPRLVDVGATGALLWCFADYAPELWDRPPCDPAGAKHERHFGLVRPDGTLKPHAEAVAAFAASQPTVRRPVKTVSLDVSPDEYYRDPATTARRLYDAF